MRTADRSCGHRALWSAEPWSHDRDLMGSGRDEHVLVDVHAAERRLVDERRLDDVIDALNTLDHGKDLGDVDAAAERPAVAVLAAEQRMEERIQRLDDATLDKARGLRLCPYAPCGGGGPPG